MPTGRVFPHNVIFGMLIKVEALNGRPEGHWSCVVETFDCSSRSSSSRRGCSRIGHTGRNMKGGYINLEALAKIVNWLAA